MSAGRRKWQFHFVDVFAVEPLTGNSLAVVEDAADLTVEQLQRIAPTRPDADWRLRSFSAAGAEVFGAGGHNSLGAWWWLADAGKLNLKGGLTVFHQEMVIVSHRSRSHKRMDAWRTWRCSKQVLVLGDVIKVSARAIVVAMGMLTL